MRKDSNPLVGEYKRSNRDVRTTSSCCTAKSVRAFSQLRRITIRIMQRDYIAKTAYPLGRVLTTDEAEQRLPKRPVEETYTIIPEDGELPSGPRHSMFGVAEDRINSNAPERDAAERIEVLNEFDVSEEEVDSVRALITELTNSSKDMIIKECVLPFVSFDNASSMTEAIMRDGLGIPLEVETEIKAALSDITRLSFVSHYVNQADSIPADVKAVYLKRFAKLLAANSLENINKKGRSEKYSGMLREVIARVRSENGKDVTPVESNPMAAMRTRGGKLQSSRISPEND